MRALLRCDRCIGDGRVWGIPCRDCDGTGRVEDRAATDDLVLAAGQKFGSRTAEEFLDWLDENRELVMPWLAEVGWVRPSKWGFVRVPGSDPTVPKWSDEYRLPTSRVVNLDDTPDVEARRLYIVRGAGE